MKLTQSLKKQRSLKFPLIIRRIHGISMLPLFNDGKVILAYGWFRRLRPGDVIILKHQGLEKIKQVEKIVDEKLWVRGLNPSNSTDSRHFGWVDKGCVTAKLF